MSNSLARMIMICIIWVVFAILSATLLIVQRAEANFLIIGIFALAAVISTHAITENTENEEKEIRKAKREAGSFDQTQMMLSLLDENDVEELRSRIKSRLLQTVERGEDGELSSLEALIAEQETRQSRR